MAAITINTAITKSCGMSVHHATGRSTRTGGLLFCMSNIQLPLDREAAQHPCFGTVFEVINFRVAVLD